MMQKMHFSYLTVRNKHKDRHNIRVRYFKLFSIDQWPVVTPPPGLSINGERRSHSRAGLDLSTRYVQNLLMNEAA